MSVSAGEALQGLAAAFGELLPEAVRPTLVVAPGRLRPVGLGGYVGPAAELLGDVFGQQLEATAHVMVRAAGSAQLVAAVNNALGAVLAVDRGTLARRGILRLNLAALGPEEQQPGAGSDLQRELIFGVTYEHLREPTASDGVIEELRLNLTTDELPLTPRRAFRVDFASDPLPLFEAVDDPQASIDNPSQWAYSPADDRIEQRSTIGGGPQDSTPEKPGAYLVLRADAARPAVRDFTLTADMGSDSSGGIGLVFRWLDVDNFYFALLDRQGNFRMLARKVAGNFGALETPAADLGASFTPATPFALTLDVQGPEFRLFVDRQLALTGSDSALGGPGRVGLMTRGNNGAFFSSLELVEV